MGRLLLGMATHHHCLLVMLLLLLLVVKVVHAGSRRLGRILMGHSR